jgi:hypothetical protein
MGNDSRITKIECDGLDRKTKPALTSLSSLMLVIVMRIVENEKRKEAQLDDPFLLKVKTFLKCIEEVH